MDRMTYILRAQIDLYDYGYTTHYSFTSVTPDLDFHLAISTPSTEKYCILSPYLQDTLTERGAALQ